SEAEWQACQSPFDMLRYLDGKIGDEAFMGFSVACCRRIWALLTDPRSRAVVDATDAYLKHIMTAEQAAEVCTEWEQAREKGDVEDLVGGNTNDAIESVYGLGYGHASQVASACFECAGYAASRRLQSAGASQADVAVNWKTAAREESLAQCRLLRQMFGYVAVDPAAEHT